MAKRRNRVNEIRQYVAGEHTSQNRTAIGFHDAETIGERQKVREDGEIWPEKDSTGQILCWWELKDGIKVKTNVHPDIAKKFREIREYLNSFPNCPKEKCTCISPNSLDRKFQRRTGMCSDCTLSYETKLKMRGQFNEYALSRMKHNAEGYFRDADKEIELLKEELKNTEFINSERGDIEKWDWEGVKQYIAAIDQYYDEYKQKTLERLDASNNGGI